MPTLFVHKPQNRQSRPPSEGTIQSEKAEMLVGQAVDAHPYSETSFHSATDISRQRAPSPALRGIEARF